MAHTEEDDDWSEEYDYEDWSDDWSSDYESEDERPLIIVTEQYSSKVYKDAKDPCVICQEDYEEGVNIAVLPDCGHLFHDECLRTWAKRKKQCPLCRAKIDVENILPPSPVCSLNHPTLEGYTPPVLSWVREINARRESVNTTLSPFQHRAPPPLSNDRAEQERIHSLLSNSARCLSDQTRLQNFTVNGGDGEDADGDDEEVMEGDIVSELDIQNLDRYLSRRQSQLANGTARPVTQYQERRTNLSRVDPLANLIGI